MGKGWPAPSIVRSLYKNENHRTQHSPVSIAHCIVPRHWKLPLATVYSRIDARAVDRIGSDQIETRPEISENFSQLSFRVKEKKLASVIADQIGGHWRAQVRLVLDWNLVAHFSSDLYAIMKILLRADTHVNIELPENAPVAKCTFTQVEIYIETLRFLIIFRIIRVFQLSMNTFRCNRCI